MNFTAMPPEYFRVPPEGTRTCYIKLPSGAERVKATALCARGRVFSNAETSLIAVW